MSHKLDTQTSGDIHLALDTLNFRLVSVIMVRQEIGSDRIVGYLQPGGKRLRANPIN
ncbi:hypothetical protein D1872_316640 [compost metagenome]